VEWAAAALAEQVQAQVHLRQQTPEAVEGAVATRLTAETADLELLSSDMLAHSVAQAER